MNEGQSKVSCALGEMGLSIELHCEDCQILVSTNECEKIEGDVEGT